MSKMKRIVRDKKIVSRLAINNYLNRRERIKEPRRVGVKNITVTPFPQKSHT